MYTLIYACMTKMNGIVSLHAIDAINCQFFYFSFLCIEVTNIYVSFELTSSSRAPKHVWTKEEETTLVECMVELVSAGGWKSDNGMFRRGYMA